MRYFILVFCLFFSSSLMAQQQSVKLLTVIQQLKTKHQLVFSYNPTLLEGVEVPSFNLSEDLASILQKLSTVSAFNFNQLDAKNILVKAKQSGKNFKLCLSVVDADSREALAGAVVFDSQKQQGFTADLDGNGSLYINLSEWDFVHISFLGYETQSIPIARFNGQRTCPTVALQASTKALDEIEVIAYMTKGFNYQHQSQSIRLNPTDAALLPGATEVDVLTSLDALPGMNSPDGKAGNLVLRGDDPDKTLLTFDNIPIYHNGHYFGTFSPYNANVIESVEIHRTGYLANKGGRIGGSIEIVSKSQIPKKAASGIGLATSYLSGYTHVPLVNDKLSLLIAGRSNYPVDWDSPKIEAIHEYIYTASDFQPFISTRETPELFDYNFNDLNIKSIYQVNQQHQLSASFLTVNTKLDAAILKNRIRHVDLAQLRNWGLNLAWNSQWSDRFSSAQSITYSHYEQRYHSQDIARNPRNNVSSEYEHEINDLSVKLEGNWRIKQNHHLNFGYQLQNHEVNFFNQDIDDLNEITSTASTAIINTLFANYTINFQDQADLTAGIRSSYYGITNQVYIEPRLLFNYYVNDAVTVKSNMGIYNQFLTQVAGTSVASLNGISSLNWQLTDGSSVPVVNSKQIMLGTIIEKGDWLIDLEGYYKDIQQLTISELDQATNSNFFIYGGYSTKGLDVLVKRSWNKLHGWVSYTLSKTLFDFAAYESEPFRSVWDQTHLVNTVMSYQSDHWDISAGWKFKSGLGMLNGFRNNYLLGKAGPSRDRPGNGNGSGAGGGDQVSLAERGSFPSHHQLDISISYKFVTSNQKLKGNIGLSLYNIYDKRPIVRQNTNTQVAGIGFAPSLMINVRF